MNKSCHHKSVHGMITAWLVHPSALGCESVKY